MFVFGCRLFTERSYRHVDGRTPLAASLRGGRWKRGGEGGQSSQGSGGEVGVLHGVETVDWVSHPPRQETTLHPRCQETVAEVTEAAVAVQIVEHRLGV